VTQIYQAFALLCARQEVRRALVKAGDQDADEHHALRDTLLTVGRVAQIPLRFRLALVASSDPVGQVFARARDELKAFGCDVRVFLAEGDATRWLVRDDRVPALEDEPAYCPGAAAAAVSDVPAACA
jgi:hypothetical protein